MNTMDKNDRDYRNKDIIVHWKPGKCIHATTCYRELIEVFNPRKRPWVNMDGASTERIIEVVNKCPTDALTYSWIDKDQEAPPQEPAPEVINEIRIMKDGPVVVKGEFEITGSGKGAFKKMKMTSFCRCGASKNMPFCDGSHRKIGFKEDE